MRPSLRRASLAPPLLAVVAAAGLASCATVEPGEGFDDIARTVSERTGAEVRWNPRSPGAREIDETVDELLARDLTAAAAVQVALLNNRGLRALYEDLSVAQADLVEAGLLRNPVLDGSLRFDTAGGGTGVELALVQNFLDAFFIPLRKRRAEAALESAKLRITGAVVGHAAEVRREFYALQAAEQLIEMRRTGAEATAASRELAERLREAGNTTALDLANEQAMDEEARVALAEAHAEAAARRERLNALMGLWGGRTGWTTAPRLPELPGEEPAFEDIERRAVEASLDLGIARRGIEIAARDLGVARPAALIPELEAGVAAEREVEGGWSVGPALAVPIPIFDQGQGAVARSEAELRRAREGYAARAVEVRARARAAHAAVLSARDRAEHYRAVILPLRARIVEQTQLQYNAMQVGAFQLLQARRDLIGAGADSIAALRDYWDARTDLDTILAGRLPGAAATGDDR